MFLKKSHYVRLINILPMMTTLRQHFIDPDWISTCVPTHMEQELYHCAPQPLMYAKKKNPSGHINLMFKESQ